MVTLALVLMVLRKSDKATNVAKNFDFSVLHCDLTPLATDPPRIFARSLYRLKVDLGYIFVLILWVYLFSISMVSS